MLGWEQGDTHRVLAQYLLQDYDQEDLLKAFKKSIDVLNEDINARCL